MERLIAIVLLAVLAAEAKPRDIRYLPPVAFKNLPAKVVADLQKRKCMIPQYPRSWMFHDRINVTAGELSKTGQKDWAVLCTNPVEVTLLVYWNGSEKDPATIPIGSKTAYWYSGLMPQDLVKKTYAAKMPDLQLDHDAICITDEEERTIIRYFQNGKWTSFRGIPHDEGH